VEIDGGMLFHSCDTAAIAVWQFRSGSQQTLKDRDTDLHLAASVSAEKRSILGVWNTRVRLSWDSHVCGLASSQALVRISLSCMRAVAAVIQSMRVQKSWYGGSDVFESVLHCLLKKRL
jgi:hypothetical protein